MLIPHQGLPIGPSAMLAGTLKYVVGKCDDSLLKRWIHYPHTYWTSSGRNALKLILKNIGAKTVGVPSFTCRALDTAIRSAGSKPYYFDSSPIADYSTIYYNIDNFDALVLPYNFGFLPDCERIARICKQNNVTLIEDCCAALGARYNKTLAGDFGDYSFYSFGVGKSGFANGLIGSKTSIDATEEKSFPSYALFRLYAFGILNPILFSRSVYPLFYNSLMKNLKKTPEPPECKPSNLAKCIDLQLLKRYEQFMAVRKSNAQIMMAELEGVIDFIKPLKASQPSWLYFVFMVKKRAEFLKRMLCEKVHMMELLEYADLSGSGNLAKDAADMHATISLYRPESQIDYIINKIKVVCRHGNY